MVLPYHTMAGQVTFPKRASVENCVKNELDVKAVQVKPELLECIVCAGLSSEASDMFSTTTQSSGGTLYSFLCRFAGTDVALSASSRLVCQPCTNLINILEQAEFEYKKLKQTFEEIISKNPLFSQPNNLVGSESNVKEELYELMVEQKIDPEDSEDEPLAKTRKRRHQATEKKKKKVSNISSEVSTVVEANLLEIVSDFKKEDSIDGSQSSHFDNGFESASDCIKLEPYADDDDSSDFTPKGDGKCRRKRKAILLDIGDLSQKRRKRKEAKTIHKCDQCNAKYTSLVRLEQHMKKHDGSKPPYICEVCGAHYKHKRACDIHIALHKGISDWKCEECNKLFPSKGALRRHNNIHTGKTNYQCDQCGKSFIHTSSFKMHKLAHSGVKPHTCAVCGLALMTRSHLTRHARIHSGEKRHECGVCGKRFSERYNLMAHSKSHASRAASPAPRRRLFRCPYCVERFERRYMLERHCSATHGRTLERAPPTPRNTMSKLLKQQAAKHAHPSHAGAESREPKSERTASPPPAGPAPAPAKSTIVAAPTIIAAGSWSNAYTTQFDFQH